MLDADTIEHAGYLKPSIIIAPGYAQVQAVGTALVDVATKLEGFAYLDADHSGTDAAAITYRNNFDSKHAMTVWPAVQYFNTHSASTQTCPSSAVFAGVRASLDSQPYGFAQSVSNRVIQGITGVTSPVQFQQGDIHSQANLLNADEVSTIIRIGGGFRTWGNRTMSSDSKFAFETRVRIDYAIQQSLVAAHLWAVDKQLTRTYFEDVAASVQAYLDELKSPKAQVIVDGSCWVDPSDNQPSNLEQGHATFRYDFVDTPTAERITFTRTINSEYLTQLTA